MSSLSSSMFAGYNKFDDAKVRIGSWREELAMKELTGVTRLANPRNKAVFNATGVRVLYHADKPGGKDPGEGKTVSETSFVHPQKELQMPISGLKCPQRTEAAKVPATKDSAAHAKPGPRAVCSKHEARATVALEEAERAALEMKKKEEMVFDTTFRQSYKGYSDDASRAAKQESAKPRPDRSGQTQPSALARDAATDGGDTGTIPGIEIGNYSTGATVTLWNTGGMAPGGRCGTNSFGRTSRFTEPGVHPSFFQEVWPDPAPHHASLPRHLSDLEAASIMFLKRRVIERGREKPLPTVRGLWRLLWSRTYRDAVGKIGPQAFREGMAEFQVPVTQCEVWAVTTAFDTDGGGQICLDKLIHFFRAGGLSATRRNMVHKLFQELDSANTGAVSLGHIRAACDFSSLPTVTYGKVRGDEVTAAFLQHFIGGERSQEEIVVSAEKFQEVFRDIGTACIALEKCSWKAACPTKCEGDAQTDDEENNDALFMGVISSLR